MTQGMRRALSHPGIGARVPPRRDANNDAQLSLVILSIIGDKIPVMYLSGLSNRNSIPVWYDEEGDTMMSDAGGLPAAMDTLMNHTEMRDASDIDAELHRAGPTAPMRSMILGPHSSSHHEGSGSFDGVKQVSSALETLFNSATAPFCGMQVKAKTWDYSLSASGPTLKTTFDITKLTDARSRAPLGWFSENQILPKGSQILPKERDAQAFLREFDKYNRTERPSMTFAAQRAIVEHVKSDFRRVGVKISSPPLAWKTHSRDCEDWEISSRIDTSLPGAEEEAGIGDQDERSRVQYALTLTHKPTRGARATDTTIALAPSLRRQV